VSCGPIAHHTHNGEFVRHVDNLDITAKNHSVEPVGQRGWVAFNKNPRSGSVIEDVHDALDATIRIQQKCLGAFSVSQRGDFLTHQ
jgi:hypothetical protein